MTIPQPIAPDPVADLAAWRLRRQRNCPLIRAAVRLGDPAVLAAVLQVHPPWLCPAARTERAA